MIEWGINLVNELHEPFVNMKSSTNTNKFGYKNHNKQRDYPWFEETNPKILEIFIKLKMKPSN